MHNTRRKEGRKKKKQKKGRTHVLCYWKQGVEEKKRRVPNGRKPFIYIYIYIYKMNHDDGNGKKKLVFWFGVPETTR